MRFILQRYQHKIVLPHTARYFTCCRITRVTCNKWVYSLHQHWAKYGWLKTAKTEKEAKFPRPKFCDTSLESKLYVPLPDQTIQRTYIHVAPNLFYHIPLLFNTSLKISYRRDSFYRLWSKANTRSNSKHQASQDPLISVQPCRALRAHKVLHVFLREPAKSFRSSSSKSTSTVSLTTPAL